MNDKENVKFFNSTLDDFFVSLYNYYGNGSTYYCVGERCGYFFLANDVPDDLKRAYPKTIYLHNFLNYINLTK
jgi:hypothetical protein